MLLKEAASAPSRREIAGVALLAGAVVLWRLAMHPHFLLDEECSVVNTVGREWALGHARGLPTAWQIIAYQGSFLVDAALSALGYLAFGDRLIAWMWVPAAYVLAFAGLGGQLAGRLGGRAGLYSFGALWAVAPFLLKDGLIAFPGAHATSLVWALAALVALEVADREDSPGFALLAGALAGFATWYTRSAVLAAAVVPFSFVFARRWRLARSAALGVLAFPLLMALNVLGLALDGPWEGRPPLGHLLTISVWRVNEIGSEMGEPLRKLAEQLGIGLRAQLFGAAPGLDGETVSGRAGGVAGGVWAAAFTLSWVGAGVLALWALARRRATLLASSGILVLYVLAYVLSPMSIEPESLQGSAAPSPTSVRYLLPGLLAAVVFAGTALGALIRAGGLRRGLGIAALASLVVAGLPPTLQDHSDRAAWIWSERLPFRYEKVFGWNRGPNQAHTEATSPVDLVSRAARLRSLGSMRAAGPSRLADDAGAALLALDRATTELRLDADERRLLAHGMGMSLADHLWSSQEIGGERLLALAVAAAARLGDEGAAYLIGFAEGAADGVPLLVLDPTTVVPTLCAPLRDRGRPLCRLAGIALGGSCEPGWVEALRTAAVEQTDVVPGQHVGVVPELLRGAAWWQARSRGPWQRGPCGETLAGAERAAWEEGWDSGSRFRWRTDIHFERPDRVP